jgi:PAS domain S-box-containing protein
MNLEGVIVDFDDAAEALLGHSRDDVLGRRLADVMIPPRLRAAHDAGLRHYRDTGEGPLLDNRFELPALRGDGSEIMVDLLVTRTEHEGWPAFTGRLRPLRLPAAVAGELHRHEDFYRVLVEQSPVVVTVLDENGVPVWRSPGVGGMFAGGAPEGSGRSLDEQLSDIVHPADLDRARGALHQAVAEGLDDPVELRVKAGDGSWHAVAMRARNLLAHPAVRGTALYGTDVSRARAAEQQARIETTRLMTLIESLKVAILLQDEHERVVLANSAYVEMFSLGIAPERLRGAGGSPLAGLYAGSEETEQRIQAAIRRGRPVHGEEITLIDGRVLERDCVPIMLDGSALGFLWVFRDVTAHAEVRRSLEERARMLAELSRLKTEFVGVVSHELRTPLASINTFASLLEDDATLSAHDRSAAMSAIRRNADRMFGLVADLVLLAKLESGDLALDDAPVDLPALVRDAAERVAATAGRDVNLRLDLHDGPGLPGDSDLLTQLVELTVGALVVGSAPGAEVVVRAEPQLRSWLLTVTTSAADTTTIEQLLSTRLPRPGAGDAADDAGGGSAAGEGRTGALAVMLARAITARHGGELSIAVGDPGARLTIDLPIRG